MKVTRTFIRNVETKKRLVVNRGWSSSSKTYSILQMYFKRLTTWELRKNEWIPKWVSTVARQYRAELYTSVLRDFYNIVEAEWFLLSNRFAWWRYIKENKSLLTFEYGWRTLEFIWTDDPEKVKWPRRKSLYCNEANNIAYWVFKQMLMRTEWVVFIDFNPDDDEVWINEKIEQERASKIWDVEVIVSTFRDNAFLQKSIVDEILNLRITDPDLWNVYWNWQYWKIKGAIFQENIHWQVIDEIPQEANFMWYWQDYWFTTDPTTLIWIYKYWKNAVILDEVIREYNLVNTYQDEAQRLESIQWQYEFAWVDTSSKIWADSSEQKSNEELYQVWYNIEWVTKWPWSVISWIKFMKKYKIFITAKSLNLRKEFKKYVWAVDKNWKTLKDKEWRPIPVDKNNHWIDAARYWMTNLLWWPDMSELDFSIW